MKSRLLASVVGVCTVAGIREKAEEVKVRYFVEISPDRGRSVLSLRRAGQSRLHPKSQAKGLSDTWRVLQVHWRIPLVTRAVSSTKLFS